MIERKKLIEDLKPYLINNSIHKNDLAEVIANQPRVNTWISVKDKLPPKPRIGEDGYIVQEKNVIEPFSAYWDGERWTDSNSCPIDDVIAWQPLPSPYKRSEVR